MYAYRRIGLMAALVAIGVLGAAPALACSYTKNARILREIEADAFKEADTVVTVIVKSETYKPRKDWTELRYGVATARVTEVHKGPARLLGKRLTYPVIDGGDTVILCEDAATRPGRRYTLFFDNDRPGSDLPVIIRKEALQGW